MEQLRQKPLPDDKDELEMELESLKSQVYRLQLELEILQMAAEVVKTDQGIDLRKMTNREKRMVIDALREKYPLNELLAVVAISKSSYFYQKNALSRPDIYASLRKEVRDAFGKSKCVYGYRRIHADLPLNCITCSDSVVTILMLEDHLGVH